MEYYNKLKLKLIVMLYLFCVIAMCRNGLWKGKNLLPASSDDGDSMLLQNTDGWYTALSYSTITQNRLNMNKAFLRSVTGFL
jgi:hypothetical protein